MELSEEKSKKGLGEIYAEDFLAKAMVAGKNDNVKINAQVEALKHQFEKVVLHKIKITIGGATFILLSYYLYLILCDLGLSTVGCTLSLPLHP